MKKAIFFLGCCLLGWGTSNLWAQQGFVATGGQSDGAAGNVSFSIGQMNYLSATGLSGAINEGLQQPEGGLSIFGILSYDNLDGTPINDATVLLKQGSTVVSQTTTDLAGFFQFSNPESGSYYLDATSSKPWGSVNATDALLILKHFVGADLLTGLRLTASDVNASGNINAADALQVLKRFVGLQSSFVTGDWVFEHPVADVSGTSLNIDFKGILYGDVDGSYTPVARLIPTLFLANQGVQLVESGQVLDIPVSVKDPVNCAAISLILNYPESAFEILGVEAAYDNQTLAFNAVAGELRIGWYTLGPKALNTGDLLMTLRVKVKNPANLTSVSTEFALNAASSLADYSGTELLSKTLVMPSLVFDGQGFNLGQNIPNPFSNLTQIAYVLPQDGTVKLELLDVVGQQIAVLEEGLQAAGSHQVTLSGNTLQKGVYFYRMSVITGSQQYTQTKRMVVSR